MNILFLAKNSPQFSFYELVSESLISQGFHPIIVSQYDFLGKYSIPIETIWPRRGENLNGSKKYLSPNDFSIDISKYLFADREIRHFNKLYYPGKNLNGFMWSYVEKLHITLVQLLERYQPEVVVSEFVTGVFDGLLYELCLQRGIPFVSVRQSKLTPGIIFCLYNKDMPAPSLLRAKEFDTSKRIKPNTIFENRAKDGIDKINKQYELPSYMVKTKSNIKLDLGKLRLFATRISWAYKYGSFTELLDSIRWYFRKRYHLSKYSKIEFTNFSELSGIDYHIFPLHYEPEQSVDIRGYPFGQIELIEKVAKILPINSYLVVKEHRGNRGYRDHRDYERILSLPNVLLVNPDTDNYSLVTNASSVITISGRMGWEALCMQKPVYVFGDSFYCDIAKNKPSDNLQSLIEFLQCPEKFIVSKKTVTQKATHYEEAIKTGNFVLNSDAFLTPDNIENFVCALKSYLKQ